MRILITNDDGITAPGIGALERIARELSDDVWVIAPELDQSGVALTDRGNVAANIVDYATSEPKVFTCGDMRRGQSLVVWAIREGRQAARAVDEFLMGSSELPR